MAAHADIVMMMYRPWLHATDNEKIEGVVTVDDSEGIFVKNRSGDLGTAEFIFDAPRMLVRDL